MRYKSLTDVYLEKCMGVKTPMRLRHMVYRDSVITEGGTIFSTRRINRSEIIPTIKHLEQLTGMSLQDKVLGSTGKKESSGDIDLVIDSSESNKDSFKSMLLSKGVDQASLKMTGIEIAYKSPIIDSNGNETDDFIQVDFNFHENPEFLKFYYANNESVHKGSDRNILISSIAKHRGLLLGNKGLYKRDPKEFITYDPNSIVKYILGDDATEADMNDINSIIKYLKKHYDDDTIKQIIEPAETTTGKTYI